MSRDLAAAPQRVADYVRNRINAWRDPNPLSADELVLAGHLRGNEKLYDALIRVIGTRISGRARLPVPSDPIVCKSILERDNELRWLLSRLESVYRSAVSQPADNGEHSA